MLILEIPLTLLSNIAPCTIFSAILSGGWIFSICIIGIVLLVCVPFLIWKYSLTKKLQIQGTHSRDKDRHNDQAIISLQHHEYIDVENEYEEIDDNAIVGIVCQMQHGMETVSINSKSSSERSYIEPENNRAIYILVIYQMMNWKVEKARMIRTTLVLTKKTDQII